MIDHQLSENVVNDFLALPSIQELQKMREDIGLLCKSDLARAIQQAEKALSYESLEKEEATIQSYLAYSFEHQNMYEESIRTALESLEVARKYKLTEVELRSLNSLAKSYAQMTLYTEALEALAKVEKLTHKHNIKEAEAKATTTMAWVSSSLQDYNEAIALSTRARSLYRTLGDKAQEAAALIQISNGYLAMGYAQKALHFAEQAKKVAVESGQNEQMANVHLSLGDIYKHMQDFEKALKHFKKALSYQTKSKNSDSNDRGNSATYRVLNHQTLLKIGATYRDMGNTVKALNFIQRALELVEVRGQMNVLYNCHLELSLLYKKMGDYRTSLQHFQQYHKFEKDVLAAKADSELRALKITREVESAKREATLLKQKNMLDIDHFKKLNDNYSHQMGDEVLKKVAELYLDNLRNVDIAARYGGEEFSIIMPVTDLEAAHQGCERIRKAVENYPWHEFHEDMKVTVSIGLSHNLRAIDADNLVEIADKYLYKAKGSGRNRVAYMDA